MFDSRNTFIQYQNPDLQLLLRLHNVPVDAVIEAADDATITFLDVDAHHWPAPPSVEELYAHLAAVSPTPDAAWISHGRGLKLAFIGQNHLDRALAAAFRLPSSFCVEFLNHTRHPGSASSKHGLSICGPVLFFSNDRQAKFEFRTAGNSTPEARAEALHELRLELGGRYDHGRCPIDCDADSDALDCVVVLDGGIYCHRCAGRGIRHRPDLPPGFVPFTAIVGGEPTDLEILGRERVHWTHARLHLRHRYPHLGENLLRAAYHKVLESMWECSDPRIHLIFNRDLDFVWGPGVWLDAQTLEPTVLDDDAASGLPYVLDVSTDEKGRQRTRLDQVRRSQAKNRIPRGYTPIRPVRGISFSEDLRSIPVPVSPAPRHPIRLLDDPMAEDPAFQVLERAFPRLDPTYFKACLGAGVCADAVCGQPPMVTCSGPSGSAKEQTVRLAASFMGQQIIKLTLDEGEEAFFRQIGAAVAAGNRFLLFDELGKTRNLLGKLKLIYALSNSVRWRKLYKNGGVSTPLHAAFFFPCVYFPDFLKTSQEFARRTRHVHLHRRVPNWMGASGGDTAEWRDRTPENARVANSLMTLVWRQAREFGFRFL